MGIFGFICVIRVGLKIGSLDPRIGHRYGRIGVTNTLSITGGHTLGSIYSHRGHGLHYNGTLTSIIIKVRQGSYTITIFSITTRVFSLIYVTIQDKTFRHKKRIGGGQIFKHKLRGLRGLFTGPGKVIGFNTHRTFKQVFVSSVRVQVTLWFLIHGLLSGLYTICNSVSGSLRVYFRGGLTLRH